ncbi:uncharacterized protein LOC129716811 [Wyeomyia smithii]|uniref:uncharacterized protein LOC129716811 n=1 Tax=Wyeomyia smithii TaxID=174621 RepID=UPI002467EF31|nr:uncharacterized protein LOC129716811 [Wyeomyia smithii]
MGPRKSERLSVKRVKLAANIANLAFMETDSEKSGTIPEVVDPGEGCSRSSAFNQSQSISESSAIEITNDLEAPVAVASVIRYHKAPQPETSSIEQDLNDTATIIKKLEDKISSLTKQNERLTELNFKLQHAVTNTTGATFTELPGYPKKDWLIKVTQSCKDSDYMFVKELLIELFPEGTGDATVTGKSSNNPGGVKGLSAKPVDTPDRTQLDPSKVGYMKDRLYERRLIMQDSPGTAYEKAVKKASLITRVTSNNPGIKHK